MDVFINLLTYFHQLNCVFGLRFWDKTPYGADREGHVWGGVQNPKENGFTKNTHTNSFGSVNNSSDTLRRLEPYVAR